MFHIQHGIWASILLPGLLFHALTGSRTLHGESFPLSFVAPPGLAPPANETLEMLAREHADRMYRNLLLRIDEIDQVCELGEEQKSLLRSAAKGTVQDSFEEWVNPLLSTLLTGPQAEQTKLMRKLGVNPDADRQVVIQNFVQAARVQRLAEVRAIPVLPPPRVIVNGIVQPAAPAPARREVTQIDDRVVLEHVIFRSALRSVLTADQLARLEAADSRRTAGVVRAQQDLLLAEVGNWLAMTDEQLAGTRPLLEQVQDAQVRVWCHGELELPVLEIALRASGQLPPDKMKSLLSPVQFDIWTDLKRQYQANLRR